VGGPVPVGFNLQHGRDPGGGRPPWFGCRRTARLCPAAGLSRGLLALGLLLCLPAAGLAAANEGIRLRLSDQLSEDVRDDRPSSEQAARFLPRFSALTLEVTVAALHDDNVLRSSANEVSSPILRTAPKAMLELGSGRHDLNLGYQGEYAHHFDISDEDYFDHELIGDAGLRLSRRLKLGLDTGLLYGHDRRGDFSSRLTGAPEPDRWRRYHAGINATFGRAWATAPRTKAGLGIGFQQSGTRYLNNDQGPRDFDRQSFAFKGRYNLGPKLSLVADSGLSITDYTDPTTPLDSREVSGLVGVAWEATAKTSGEVKFGVLEKDFDDPSQSDFSGANFDIKAQWSPRSFSIFTAYASRDTSDTGEGGGSAVVDTAGLRWRHGFSSRFHTEAGFQYQQADFESGREDDFYKVDLTANYRFSRFILLRGGVEYQTRDSSDPAADYDNSIFFVELGLMLERRSGGGRPGN
jgi:hypothetical protein